MINPFFVPVTHVALIFDTIEGVALIGLATLFGIGLALIIEGMGRKVRQLAPTPHSPVRFLSTPSRPARRPAASRAHERLALWRCGAASSLGDQSSRV